MVFLLTIPDIFYSERPRQLLENYTHSQLIKEYPLPGPSSDKETLISQIIDHLNRKYRKLDISFDEPNNRILIYDHSHDIFYLLPSIDTKDYPLMSLHRLRGLLEEAVDTYPKYNDEDIQAFITKVTAMEDNVKGQLYFDPEFE